MVFYDVVVCSVVCWLMVFFLVWLGWFVVWSLFFWCDGGCGVLFFLCGGSLLGVC